jgi:hypothetical protein
MDRIAIQQLMEGLGISLDNSPADRQRFADLQELLANFLFDWLDDKEADLEELRDSAQEWLVG